MNKVRVANLIQYDLRDAVINTNLRETNFVSIRLKNKMRQGSFRDYLFFEATLKLRQKIFQETYNLNNK